MFYKCLARESSPQVWWVAEFLVTSKTIQLLHIGCVGKELFCEKKSISVTFHIFLLFTGLTEVNTSVFIVVFLRN